MFSAMNALGERPNENPEWYGMPDVDQSEGDVDFVRASSFAPDAGFPPQRINTYDAELEEPTTLNGARTVAPSKHRQFSGLSMIPKFIARGGAPRTPAKVAPATSTIARPMFSSPVTKRW